MRRGALLMAVSLVLLVAGVVPLVASLAGWGEADDAMTDLEALAQRSIQGGQVAEQEALPPDILRARARGAGDDCGRSVPAWWDLVDQLGDDAEAYKAIALCGRADRIQGVLTDTARIFEQSRVLGVVTAVLDDMQVKDLLPILRDVETREDKGAAEWHTIAVLRRQVGDVSGAVQAFQHALVLAPDDSALTLALGHALLGQGEVGQARDAFRQGLRKGDLELSLARVYAGAVAWPSAFLGLVFGLLGLSVGLTWRQAERLGGDTATDEGAWSWRGGAMLAAVVGTGALGIAFQSSASRLAFGLLSVVAWGSALWLCFVPLRGPLAAGLRGFWERVRLLAAGRIDRELSRLSARQQLALLLGTVASIFFVIPLVRTYDLRLGLMFLAVTLLFSTLGSLLRGRLDQAGSLRSTLRWLATAGTLPFLLFFVYVEQDVLLEPLRHGHMVSRGALNRLFGYLLVWGVGLWFALLLSRILSRSILEPIDQVVGTLQRVRAGDFGARTHVERRDEIGQLGGAVDEMAGALRDREELRDTFRRYVDPQVAERLMANDESVMSGREAHATVLFSDVRGFTAMSERLSPSQVVQVLNAYFGLMDPIVRRWGGVVDKFIGDGMMAVWDVPEPHTTGPHAGVSGEILAVEAGLDMLEALAPFNRDLVERGLPELEIGIGVHAGELVAGPVGSPERLEYTVIGDTVNTSARLEGQARGGASLLVTETIIDAVEGRVRSLELAPMTLKGKALPVRVFQVEGRR